MSAAPIAGAHRPRREQWRSTGGTVGLIAAGLALSWVVEPPVFWGVLAVLGAGVWWRTVRRVGRGRRPRHLAYRSTFALLPVLLTLGAALFLRLTGSLVGLLAGIAAVGVLLAVVLVAEDQTFDPFDADWRQARFLLSLVTYLTAFALFAAIYNSRARSLLSATAITVLAALLALELFRASETQVRRAALYAGVVGLLVGEATWGLNWWPISGLAGGLFLLLVFYTVTGIVQQAFAGRLTRQTIVEFGGVALAGLAFLLMSKLWLK